jgi:hypothetical protein
MRKRTKAVDDPDEGSSTSTRSSGGSRVAKMVGASAMSIPKLYGFMLKGFLVDTPLAVTEGLRATPRLYGEEVKDHEPITGFRSGMRVAGSVCVFSELLSPF